MTRSTRRSQWPHDLNEVLRGVALPVPLILSRSVHSCRGGTRCRRHSCEPGRILRRPHSQHGRTSIRRRPRWSTLCLSVLPPSTWTCGPISSDCSPSSRLGCAVVFAHASSARGANARAPGWVLSGVQVTGKAQTSLLMWLPVDKSFESGDQSAVDTGLWNGVAWVPLGLALRALRPLGKSVYRLTLTAQAQLAALEEWMAQSHNLPEVVAMLWTSAAALRIQKVVRNPLFDQHKRSSEARRPMLVLSNPLCVTHAADDLLLVWYRCTLSCCLGLASPRTPVPSSPFRHSFPARAFASTGIVQVSWCRDQGLTLCLGPRKGWRTISKC